jgi:hypothetical protein
MIKKILIGLAIVFIAIIALRFFTPEDTWLCQKGEWVKHGQPSNPAPTTLCQ